MIPRRLFLATLGGLAMVNALLSAPACDAHELLREVVAEEAITVHFHHADGAGLAQQDYEVFRPGENQPFQVGRTDALGRLVFAPDRAGEWRVRVFSTDGHGADFTVTVDGAGRFAAVERTFFDRHTRLLVGIAFILGFFGVLRLFIDRSRRGASAAGS